MFLSSYAEGKYTKSKEVRKIEKMIRKESKKEKEKKRDDKKDRPQGATDGDSEKDPSRKPTLMKTASANPATQSTTSLLDSAEITSRGVTEFLAQRSSLLPIRQGWLDVKIAGIWKRRWFVLYSNGIMLYHRCSKVEIGRAHV